MEHAYRLQAYRRTVASATTELVYSRSRLGLAFTCNAKGVGVIDRRLDEFTHDLPLVDLG